MTTKQQRVVKEILENDGNVSKAMLKAGYAPSTAKNPHLLKKIPEIQDALQSLLKSKGITLDKALQPIADGLEAEKLIAMGKGEDSFIDRIPDMPTRLQASDRALRLLNITSAKEASFNSKELSEALRDNVDEVQLVQATFKRKDV